MLAASTVETSPAVKCLNENRIAENTPVRLWMQYSVAAERDTAIPNTVRTRPLQITDTNSHGLLRMPDARIRLAPVTTASTGTGNTGSSILYAIRSRSGGGEKSQSISATFCRAAKTIRQKHAGTRTRTRKPSRAACNRERPGNSLNHSTRSTLTGS